MTHLIDLYWFSGTGNSLFIAEKTKILMESFGYKCSLNPIEKQNNKQIRIGNTKGLIVPVAMQSTYPIVWEFIDNLPCSAGDEIFLIDTLGMYSGGIKGPVKKIVRSKGYSPIGAVEIRMPDFFMKKTENIKDKKIVAKAEIKLWNFCNELRNRKTIWTDIPFYSDLLSKFFRTQKKGIKWVRLFKKTVTDNCTNCGICVQLCPRNCVDSNSKHIKIDSENCILCQRCLEYCPVNAIEINGRKFIKNHLISLTEMKQMLKD